MTVRTNQPRVTLAMVAERAGVSVSTVSVILSGREEMISRYQADTIERVRHTAARLGYRPNLFATGLPTKRSPFFALVLQDFRHETLGTFHVAAYEASMLAGVIAAATDHDLYPIAAVIPRNPDENAIQKIGRVVDGGVFGSIVRTPSPLFEKFLCPRFSAGHPIVAIFPQHLSHWSTNAIDVDNTAIGRTAAELLARRRRKQWLLVQYRQTADADRLRYEAFLNLAERTGVTVQSIRLPYVTEYEARDAIARRLAKFRADGVFAPASTAAVGALLAGDKLGMRPGEDFDLVGCDCSSWKSADLPAITCIDIAWEHVGMIAVEVLAKMGEEGRSVFETRLLRPRIVVGTTCPVPAELANSQRVGTV